MNKRTSLFLSAGLLAVGIVMLCFSIFGDDTMALGKWNLAAAMLCITAANALNVIRILRERKEKDGWPKDR
jgi:hypothetical protein